MPNTRIDNPSPITPWWLPEGLLNFYASGTPFSAANQAQFTPMFVRSPVVITRFKIYVYVQSGNYDVGIYSGSPGSPSSLTLLRSIGSTPVPSPGRITGNISPGLILPPGYYWAALSCDNNTAQLSFINDSSNNNVIIGYVVSNLFPLASTTAATSGTGRLYGPLFVPSGTPTF